MLLNCTATFFLLDYKTVRGRACYQTVRRLFSLFDCQTARGRATNQPVMTAAAAAFPPTHTRRKPIILNIIIIHLLHSHIHCDVDHSCSKLPQHDLHFSHTEGNFTFKEGNFFPQHCWQHCSISNLPPPGRKSRDRGSGGGTFILVEIFTSPGPKLPIYYCGEKWGHGYSEGMYTCQVNWEQWGNRYVDFA